MFIYNAKSNPETSYVTKLRTNLDYTTRANIPIIEKQTNRRYKQQRSISPKWNVIQMWSFSNETEQRDIRSYFLYRVQRENKTIYKKNTITFIDIFTSNHFLNKEKYKNKTKAKQKNIEKISQFSVQEEPSFICLYPPQTSSIVSFPLFLPLQKKKKN